MDTRIFFVAVFIGGLVTSHAAAQLTLERLGGPNAAVGDFNQPTYLTQAPGDDNTLYVLERNDPGTTQLGKIVAFNQLANTKSTYLDINGAVTQDGGLNAMTFHPNFQSNGKLYVAMADGDKSRIIEYDASNSFAARTIFEFTHPRQVWHTVNWIGFREGDDNSLYVLSGDGGTQAQQTGFNPNNIIENLDSPFGKILRIDSSANFNSPIRGLAYDGSGIGLSLDNRVEVLANGMRNPFRASFDAQGNMFFSDVGNNSVEEINFIPASQFETPAPAPLNFGWSNREGTIETIPAPPGSGEPTDIEPIFDYLHPGVDAAAVGFHAENEAFDNAAGANAIVRGRSVAGGYVIDGRYYFADFNNGSHDGTGATSGASRGAIYSGVFDTSTPSSAFNGMNLTDLQKHSNEFEGILNDDIDLISSLSVDHAGNLYIIDFGDGGFFPPANTGEIFRLVPTCNPGDTDNDGDIDTGDLTTAIVNFTGAGGSGKSCSHGDTDADGDVDTGDLTFSIQNFTGAQVGDRDLNHNGNKVEGPCIEYDPSTGNVTIDANGEDIIRFSLQGGPFNPADFSELPAGLTDNLSSQIGWTSFNLFTGLTGVADLGPILPAGLSFEDYEAAVSTRSYGLSLAGGGGGGELYSICIIVPEPGTLGLCIVATLIASGRRRNRRAR